ncbi:MAG: phenylacetate-CoA oxygenase subunit PaaI [Gemmatimonadales bacterium]|jgi:ring-1,2-phenylacetyl-CoA epoxidase subunit PaaC
MSGPDIKRTEDLEPETRRALRDLILSLADSKRLIGILFADWVLGAPELEANIAASSISQDEWGHSRLLYALLKDFGDDPEKLEHEREPADYCNIEALDKRLETWTEFVVANAIIDTALTVQLEALADSRYTPLRQRVQKQLEEERFHFGHGVAWLRRLAGAGDRSRASLQQALDERWPAVLRWFGPDEFGDNGKANGLWNGNGGELRQRFLERAGPIIEGSGLALPSTEVDFTGWDPASRRSSCSGPDPEAVRRARGDRNREFLMD